MIASTRHPLRFANTGKLKAYQGFVKAYGQVVRDAVDFVWDGKYPKFSVATGELDLPKLLKYSDIHIPNQGLSARALQCACNQAGGIIRAVVEKSRRQVWVAGVNQMDLPTFKVTKPLVGSVEPQLNANCAEFRASKGVFMGFLKLSSLGPSFGKIIIPICRSKPAAKWMRRAGNPTNSFKLQSDAIQMAWDWARTPTPTGDDVLAIDQGMKTVATCSNGQTTPDAAPHGHTLESICRRLARKKKGSKGFKRTAQLRKNFINYSINQLNFSGFREVRLEKVVNIRFGRSSSRVMSHWTNTLIRDKIKRRCEELEVPVVEQASAYRSQRCSSCGLVRKANRKGKTYTCGCGFTADADLNAALNHVPDLPPIPWAFLGRKLNLGSGFLWNTSGFTLPDGSESIVPDDLKTYFLHK